MLYSGSDEQVKLRAIQTYLRYLTKHVNENQDIPLGITLPMLGHIEEVEEQLRYLKSAVHRAAYADMTQQDVESVDTPEWTATLLNKPSATKVRSQEVAEALLSHIQESELKRNKKLPETAVKSITATTFWTLVDTLSIKWSKTKLKKKGIDLAEFSEEGAPQNKIEVVRKTS